MSTIPTWIGASIGSPGNAGLLNQFLSSHNATYLYSGAAVVTSGGTGTAVFQSTQSQWLSQSFVTGVSQTVVGSVNIQLSAVGGSPTLNLIPSITVGIYADLGGFPTGSALVSTVLSDTYVYSSPFWVQVPVTLTVTPSTTYHIVTNLVGSANHYYTWQQSNLPGGAATAPDGTTWTNFSFGLMYQILDKTSTGLLTTISEDNGARVIQLTYNGVNGIATVTEFLSTQNGASLQSSGTLSYTNGLFTGVS